MTELLQPPVDPEIIIVSSVEQLSPLASDIEHKFRSANRRHLHDLPAEKFLKAFEPFLRSIYESPNPDILAFVNRRESLIQPILDVWTVWRDPMELDRTCYEEMENLLEQHSQFVLQVHPTISSFIHLVDTHSYPNLETLHDYLDSDYNGSSALTQPLKYVRLKR